VNHTRLLIIGSRGFVGSGLADAAAGQDFELLSDDGIDITDAEHTLRIVKSLRPDLVVLLAAIADIDRCEREKETAERVNVQGAEHVAQACADAGARLIFSSTGAVFDGQKHGYVEEDSLSPLSFYGESKARAEAVILGILPSSAIVRLSLVMGFARRPGTNSMLDKLRRQLAAGNSVAAPREEYRNPIDTGTLNEFLFALARRPEAAGIFHLGSADSISRYDLVRRLAHSWKYPESLVAPSVAAHPGRAPRGRDHFLISHKISRVCNIPLPDCEEVIEKCFCATAQGAA
jgi:dTDP-4-dehydrorhamnose reductase